MDWNKIDELLPQCSAVQCSAAATAAAQKRWPERLNELWVDFFGTRWLEKGDKSEEDWECSRRVFVWRSTGRTPSVLPITILSFTVNIFLWICICPIIFLVWYHNIHNFHKIWQLLALFYLGAKKLSINTNVFLSIPTRIGYQIDEICINIVKYDLTPNCIRINWL